MSTLVIQCTDNSTTSVAMGMVLGIIREETPKYEVLATREGYEVRKFSPGLVACTDFESDDMAKDVSEPFNRLARYIGVFTAPENDGGGKIAMTAPVLVKSEPKAIAMTAPVLMNRGEGDKKRERTMSFILPSEFGTDPENAPKPTDPKVRYVIGIKILML